MPGLSGHFARLDGDGDTATEVTGKDPRNEKPASGSKKGTSKGKKKVLCSSSKKKPSTDKLAQDSASSGWVPTIEAINQEDWTIWDPERKKNREAFQDSNGSWYFEKKDRSKVYLR